MCGVQNWRVTTNASRPTVYRNDNGAPAGSEAIDDEKLTPENNTRDSQANSTIAMPANGATPPPRLFFGCEETRYMRKIEN